MQRDSVVGFKGITCRHVAL